MARTCASGYSFLPYGYNFGDAVSSPLLEHAAGGRRLRSCAGRWNSTSDAVEACSLCEADGTPLVVGLGSVLHHLRPSLTPHALLWGTGHVGIPRHFDPQTLGEGLTVTVRAVRGVLTLRALNASAAEVRWPAALFRVPLGDPALLLPLLLPRHRRRCAPVRAVCVVPHRDAAGRSRQAKLHCPTPS